MTRAQIWGVKEQAIIDEFRSASRLPIVHRIEALAAIEQKLGGLCRTRSANGPVRRFIRSAVRMAIDAEAMSWTCEYEQRVRGPAARAIVEVFDVLAEVETIPRPVTIIGCFEWLRDLRSRRVWAVKFRLGARQRRDTKVIAQIIEQHWLGVDEFALPLVELQRRYPAPP